MTLKLKKLKLVPIFPSVLTLANLLCGFGALYYIMRAEFLSACWLVFIAMVFDMLDGKIARYAKSSSSFGIQLDSLADVISFGLVPAFLLLKLAIIITPDIHPRFVWVVSAFYLVCATLRLAQFNIRATTREEDHQYFYGLPTPGAAGVIISLTILYLHYKNFDIIILALPFVSIIISMLMVSKFRYVHFMNRFSKDKPFIRLVEVILAGLFIIYFQEIAISVVFLIFALSGPFNQLRIKIFSSRKIAATIEDHSGSRNSNNV
ncbi:MAG: CDP-diacylglycerol--serine O-phosphatidyltransferase [Planctomycetota bacterium]|nr:CDP-diacylglycerol--serine O-phosphatidyltransferase [Planctomycetota bacterium]MDI6787324.1 CDP-diacylglycerol--serine O-phosphatidyltransferase [Planctomycetota bacterium]